MPINDLKNLFEQTFNHTPLSVNELSASGSNRRYFRMQGKAISVIGAYNKDLRENEAFLGFTKHFLSKGVNVPDIIAEDLSRNIYILSDLGDETLYSYRCKFNEFTPELIQIYKDVLKNLLFLQTEGGKELNYSLAYPRAAFDHQSISWDLNYFKYYFLKLADIPFDEQLLENDFTTFTKFLLEADANFFLFRDFQSRNIMLHQNKLFFIDYQGGRKGALPYDVASLLYDGKAAIPPSVRTELLEYYIEKMNATNSWNPDLFRKYYYAFVFVRIMQAMGSYGYRGFYERKEHFLQSIPFALKNLKWLLENINLPINIPTLWKVFEQLIQSKKLNSIKQNKLTVSIASFSYKKGYPKDNSSNGGGFVFDCRCLPNPGRYEAYKHLTGLDKEVIAFLEKEKEVILFFEHITSVINMSVSNYLERDFTNLAINFGCTGGQHRSVYFAEKLANYLKNKYSIKIIVTHTAENNWEK
ncbi:MAG TPA: RNase adapter RapZ [Bacteroidales bacterium]|nr:RNase adapter RapZ [Bacteroidales bacterium]